MKYPITYLAIKSADGLIFNMEDKIIEDKDLFDRLPSGSFDYMVEENLRDIISYLFENKYFKEYDESNYYLEPGAKEFVKDIEEKWYNNSIDPHDFYSYKNFGFLDFLRWRYAEEAFQEYLKENM